MKDSITTEHPSFGQISLSRVTGHQDLYGVDFPQDHHLSLTISTSSHRRDLSNDWYFEKQLIIQIHMSETQWARFLCSPNTCGVPCTIARTNYPGEGHRGIEPLKHDTGAQGDLHRNELKATAKEAMEATSEARKKVSELLGGTSIKKSDLKEILSLLEKAEREAVANLPFVAQQAGEAIDKAKTSAMGEVEAYIGHRFQQLGSQALQDRIAEGMDRKAITQ